MKSGLAAPVRTSASQISRRLTHPPTPVLEVLAPVTSLGTRGPGSLCHAGGILSSPPPPLQLYTDLLPALTWIKLTPRKLALQFLRLGSDDPGSSLALLHVLKSSHFSVPQFCQLFSEGKSFLANPEGWNIRKLQHASK